MASDWAFFVFVKNMQLPAGLCVGFWVF